MFRDETNIVSEICFKIFQEKAHCPLEVPEPSPPAISTATTLLAPRWPLLSSCTRPCWQIQCGVRPSFTLGLKGRPTAPLFPNFLLPKDHLELSAPAHPILKNLPQPAYQQWVASPTHPSKTILPTQADLQKQAKILEAQCWGSQNPAEHKVQKYN